MRTTITTTIETPQSVKELAGTLGVSAHFVYQMRACGFRMTWDYTSHCSLATEAEARSWLRRKCFRVIKGRGVIKG